MIDNIPDNKINIKPNKKPVYDTYPGNVKTPIPIVIHIQYNIKTFKLFYFLDLNNNIKYLLNLENSVYSSLSSN